MVTSRMPRAQPADCTSADVVERLRCQGFVAIPIVHAIRVLLPGRFSKARSPSAAAWGMGQFTPRELRARDYRGDNTYQREHDDLFAGVRGTGPYRFEGDYAAIAIVCSRNALTDAAKLNIEVCPRCSPRSRCGRLDFWPPLLLDTNVWIDYLRGCPEAVSYYLFDGRISGRNCGAARAAARTASTASL
jgi:hypothetical protein